MKRMLCAAMFCLAGMQAQAASLPSHEQFEQQVKTSLAPLAGKAIAGLKVLRLDADLGPWLDTGMVLQPGDKVSVLLDGRVWLSHHYDISLEPALQVWRRIGESGPIARGMQATDTFVAEQAGTLQLKNLPTRWLDKSGRYQGDPAPVNPDAGGGVSVALIRWAPGADVAAELKRLAGSAQPPSWAVAEADRLSHKSVPPAGWQYLWELGAADIFNEATAQSNDGGPSHRLTAHTHNDVAILQKDASASLTPHTTLQWSWKVDKLPAKAPENIPIAHDYLSIAVEFDNGKDLTYLWSRELPAGQHFPCPLEGWKDRETHIVARSGSGDLGKWLNESHNVWEDYRQAVGGPLPSRIVRVWLIANSVFGRGEGKAQFGDIRIADGASKMRVW